MGRTWFLPRQFIIPAAASTQLDTGVGSTVTYAAARLQCDPGTIVAVGINL
jgi:hypothetical protein